MRAFISRTFLWCPSWIFARREFTPTYLPGEDRLHRVISISTQRGGVGTPTTGTSSEAGLAGAFNARNRIQVNFRHEKVSQVFVPQGGTVTDFGVRGDYWVRSNLSVSGTVQY